MRNEAYGRLLLRHSVGSNDLPSFVPRLRSHTSRRACRRHSGGRARPPAVRTIARSRPGLAQVRDDAAAPFAPGGVADDDAATAFRIACSAKAVAAYRRPVFRKASHFARLPFSGYRRRAAETRRGKRVPAAGPPRHRPSPCRHRRRGRRARNSRPPAQARPARRPRAQLRLFPPSEAGFPRLPSALFLRRHAPCNALDIELQGLVIHDCYISLHEAAYMMASPLRSPAGSGSSQCGTLRLARSPRPCASKRTGARLSQAFDDEVLEVPHGVLPDRREDAASGGHIAGAPLLQIARRRRGLRDAPRARTPQACPRV